MTAAKLISQAAYARRTGRAKSAVARAVAEGRITLINGLVDPDVADIQWAKNTRARVDSSRPASDTPRAEALPAVGGAAQGEDSYLMARIRRERAEAERAELDLAERRGELRRVDEIRAPIASALSALREGLLQLPKRLAPGLVAEHDQALIERTLDAAIREQLAKAASLGTGDGPALHGPGTT